MNLLIADALAQSGGQAPQGGGLMSLLPLIAIFVVTAACGILLVGWLFTLLF